jgi:hypothetical protein
MKFFRGLGISRYTQFAKFVAFLVQYSIYNYKITDGSYATIGVSNSESYFLLAVF